MERPAAGRPAHILHIEYVSYLLSYLFDWLGLDYDSLGMASLI
jgi:hypothetical protein